jgi:hypothetical protein
LLITTVELYGRTATIDLHYERDDASLSPDNTRYNKVWPTTLKTNDEIKLIIGTNQTSYLVTGSIRVDKILTTEAGPSTKNFVLDTKDLPKSTLIFFDKKVNEEAKQLGVDINCEGVNVSHSAYQLRQLRSKFNEIETYQRLRATFDLFNIVKDQPISIFTLCNHKRVDSSDSEDPANYTLGSKLFMQIATEVLRGKYKARLKKDIIESLILQFKNKNQQIPKIFENILDLFGDGSDQIRILYNNALNRHLANLASLLSSKFTKSNQDVIANLNSTMKNSR